MVQPYQVDGTVVPRKSSTASRRWPPVPKSTTRERVRPDVGRYVSDALRDRYFAACDALYALGAPAVAEQDVETSFGTTHVYRYGSDDPAISSRTPVVLVHGAGSCSAMWYPNTAALS